MIKYAVPLLHVTTSAAAEKFYCGKLGFKLEFAHRPAGVADDPCYMAVSRDKARIILSSFSGDGVAGGVVNLHIDDVDDLYVEFVANQVAVDSGPVDQTWGTREMYVKDADGNSLRFIEESGNR